MWGILVPQILTSKTIGDWFDLPNNDINLIVFKKSFSYLCKKIIHEVCTTFCLLSCRVSYRLLLWLLFLAVKIPVAVISRIQGFE
jgi:hypothetical protein